ncbi:MAG: TPM domain-containing protein [Candidatus Riflebacteria bacterium]|nr:TPM domain-containing protein [Candidatus Riflebacteria bacterium]
MACRRLLHALPPVLAGLFLLAALWAPAVSAQTASASFEFAPERYLVDEAKLVRDPITAQILAACHEIETKMGIRILIKTEILEDMTVYGDRVETFFSEWIRSIGLDKKGILLYAALPHDSLHGKFNLRVGIGLKYLITREMGEKILNRVILPNNAENNDGRGFLEGVLTIKRMLLDELKREDQRRGTPAGPFDLLSFLWASKEIFLAMLVGLFLCYFVFFVERCPRCNGTLRTTHETLKEPGNNTLGLRRKIFSCDRCGFSRRKKEPLYPSGWAGFQMWLLGTRRNVRIGNPPGVDRDLSADDRHDQGG